MESALLQEQRSSNEPRTDEERRDRVDGTKVEPVLPLPG